MESSGRRGAAQLFFSFVTVDVAMKGIFILFFYLFACWYGRTVQLVHDYTQYKTLRH
jgi:hypothetical protein